MKARQIQSFLKDPQSLTNPTASIARDLLVKSGLVIEISSNDYNALKQVFEQIDDAKKQIKLNDDKMLSLNEEICLLEERLGSFWHKLWSALSNLGTKDIKKDKDALNGKNNLVRKLRQTNSTLSNQINDLSQDQEKAQFYDSFCQETYGNTHCAITIDGQRILTALNAAENRLDETEMQDFLNEYQDIWKAIYKYIARKDEIRSYIKSNWDLIEDDKLEHFAYSLAILPIELNQILKKIETIKEFFDKQEWSDGDECDYLPIIANVIRQNGDTALVLENLKKMFEIMVEEEYDDEYYTLSEASFIIQTHSPSPEEQLERFEEIQQELEEIGWNRDKIHTGFIAANLSRHCGSPEDLSQRFRDLEETIIGDDFEDSVESGFAAIMLLGPTDSDDEQAIRFTTAFDSIIEYGWQDHSESYPIAAAIASMPGDIQENTNLLSEVCKYLNKNKDDGDNDYVFTNWSLAIIETYYQDKSKLTSKDNADTNLGRLIFVDSVINYMID